MAIGNVKLMHVYCQITQAWEQQEWNKTKKQKKVRREEWVWKELNLGTKKEVLIA